MAQLGNFGELVFEVSDRRILTYPSLTESGSANTQKHAVAGSSPIVEFIAPGGQEISLDILLSTSLGVNPATETKRLINYCNTGARFALIIGDSARGGAGALWMIDSWSVIDEITDKTGMVTKSRLSLTLILAPDPPNITATTGNVPKTGVVKRKV